MLGEKFTQYLHFESLTESGFLLLRSRKMGKRLTTLLKNMPAFSADWSNKRRGATFAATTSRNESLVSLTRISKDFNTVGIISLY